MPGGAGFLLSAVCILQLYDPGILEVKYHHVAGFVDDWPLGLDS